MPTDDDAPTIAELATAQDEQLTLDAPEPPLKSAGQDLQLGRRYVTRETIGKGGMGEVRLCTDLAIGRDVAMKVLLRSKSGSAGLRVRFEREARLQGQLEHPAIVPVYDLGSGFFTMKRVRGHTLQRILEGLAKEEKEFSTFTLRRLLVAFVQVTQAIAFAHARGVVHRDLKPGNIMLGDFGEVYVLDFGLAKVLGPSELTVESEDEDMPTRTASRTQHGALLGTPGYMPPEQARGDHDDLDPRADVYALGAILFEILALEPLHPRTSLESVMETTMLGVEARPSVRAKKRRPSPELDAVCVRATAIDRRDRHATARELAADIERFLDGERDATVKTRLASEHTEAARTALRAGDHAEAMKALSRAIALDPNEREALATMAELLLSPPADPPPEAVAELERSQDDERRSTARFGALAFFSWIFVLPFLLVAHLRTPLAWAGFAAMLALPSITAAWAARRKTALTDRVGFAVLVASTSAIALSSAYLGPFVVVPAWAAQNTLVFAMHAKAGAARFGAIAIGSLAVLGPLALELLGVIAPSHEFSGDKLELISRITVLDRVPTLVFLTGVTIALIAVPSLIVARAHDDAAEAKRRLAAHLWHLRKIVPGGA